MDSMRDAGIAANVDMCIREHMLQTPTGLPCLSCCRPPVSTGSGKGLAAVPGACGWTLVLPILASDLSSPSLFDVSAVPLHHMTVKHQRQTCVGGMNAVWVPSRLAREFIDAMPGHVCIDEAESPYLEDWPGGGRTVAAVEAAAALAAARSQVSSLPRLARLPPRDCERLLVRLMPRLCPVPSAQDDAHCTLDGAQSHLV